MGGPKQLTLRRMILTTAQAIDLANELSCTQGMLIANWGEVDYIFDLRNYVYNTYLE